MQTFLLVWSPKRWHWENLAEMSQQVKAGANVHDRWSCGNSKLPKRGDRAFIIRLGEEPRGIFASGMITEGSYEDLHWDDGKAATGQTLRFVELRLDTLLDPGTDEILPRALLDSPLLSGMHWATQMSGVRIPGPVAHELERLWASFASPRIISLPQEVSHDLPMSEGSVHQILVDAYERSHPARRACIAHYGTQCIVCGFDFEQVYGAVGQDFVHVHHLRQLSAIGEAYQVDPVEDLRPVCPNCHAIIHRRAPAYSIDEVQSFLQEAGPAGEAPPVRVHQQTPP